MGRFSEIGGLGHALLYRNPNAKEANAHSRRPRACPATCPRDCYDARGIVAIKRGGAGAVIDEPVPQFADLTFLAPSGRIEIVGRPAVAEFF